MDWLEKISNYRHYSCKAELSKDVDNLLKISSSKENIGEPAWKAKS